MRSFAFLALLLLLPASAFGQQVNGNLEGRVLDDQGNPVAYVNISVTGPDLMGVRGTVSAPDGVFRVLALPVGVYTIDVQHVSFRHVTIEGVRIALGATTSLGPVQLEAQAIEMDTMIVRAEERISFSSTEIGGRLSSEDLDFLPTERDHLAASVYLPHVNTSYLRDGINVAGSTGAENAYFIDGVNVTDPHLATGSMRLPQSFIRAIEVKAGGYQAEYGRSSGGIVNVVTHSGSNELHGQIFGFFTNNNFADGKRFGYLDLEEDDFSRYDLGASLGGPLVRDRLWFFAAYDPRVEVRDLQIPGLDTLEDRTTTHSLAGKLDWKIDPQSRLSMTLLGDPSSREALGSAEFISTNVPTSVADADAVTSDRTSGTWSLSMEGQRLLGERGLLEGRFYRVQRQSEIRPSTERGAQEPFFADRRSGLELSGGYGIKQDYATYRTGGSLKGTTYLGPHELKVGVEYEDVLLDGRVQVRTPDGIPGGISLYPDGSYSALYVDFDQENRFRLPSAFVQDSWEVTDRLEISGGLRWDGVYISDYAGDTASEITDQFQPRAGFSYQLGGPGIHQIYGSYGRFFEQLPLMGVQWHFGNYEQNFLSYGNDPRSASPDTIGVVDVDGLIAPPADDLEGPHFDEFTLGYEREIWSRTLFGARGIYRDLKRALEDSFTPDGLLLLGNPGHGALSDVPSPKREYLALELSVEKRFPSSRLAASYVLSRNHGNYPGAFPTDSNQTQPHRSDALWYQEQYAGDGPLPNDRTHVFKLHGHHSFAYGLTIGGFFTWQSGTPLSDMVELNFSPERPFSSFGYLAERGSEGRTPSIWDLNLRLAYDLPLAPGSRTQSRILLDIFHLFSQREPTSISQMRLLFYDPDTGQGVPNPVFGEAIAYQPPMTVRLGLETSF